MTRKGIDYSHMKSYGFCTHWKHEAGWRRRSWDARPATPCSREGWPEPWGHWRPGGSHSGGSACLRGYRSAPPTPSRKQLWITERNNEWSKEFLWLERWTQYAVGKEKHRNSSIISPVSGILKGIICLLIGWTSNACPAEAVCGLHKYLMGVNLQKLKHNGLLNGMDVQMFRC